MLELQEITYIAIITIESPGLLEPIQASVKVLPPSYVQLVADMAVDQQIVLKRLSECTLGDLQAFAVQMDTAIAADIVDIQLRDFAQDTGSALNINIINDKKQPLSHDKRTFWHEAMLVTSLSLEDVAQVVDLKDSADIRPLSDNDSFPFTPEARPGTLAKKATVLAQALLDDVVDGAATAAAAASAAANAAAEVIQERRIQAVAEDISIIDGESNSDDDIAIADDVFAEIDEEESDIFSDSEVVEIEEIPEREADEYDSDWVDHADDEWEDDEEEINENDPFAQVKILIDETEPVHEVPKATGPDGIIYISDEDKLHDRMAGVVLPLDDPTPAAVDILISEKAFQDAKKHASSSLNREVAGMLIGPHPQKQPNGRYVVQITDAIVAKHTRMHGASVTYTPESWRYINDTLMEMYPDEECIIVGWYHTHPGFGIFLSNMDLFIHHNFFTQKWHIALVLDPVAKRSGFFNWDRSQSQVMATHFPWPYWAHSSW